MSASLGKWPQFDAPHSFKSARWRQKHVALAGRPHPGRQNHGCSCQTLAQSESKAEARQQHVVPIDTLPPVAQRPRHVAIIMVRCC